MNLKSILTASAAILLVLNQFFVYPSFAFDESFQQETPATEVFESTGGNEQANTESSPLDVEISGNASGSESEVNAHKELSLVTVQNNNVEIVNNIKIKANTGDNEASGNSGDVVIKTGDINIRVNTVNKINTNITEEDCECESESEAERSKPSSAPSSKPSQPPPDSPSNLSTDGGGGKNGGSGASTSSSKSSIGQGQVLGTTLPETGGTFIFQSTVLALLLLLSGVILRLDYGKTKRQLKTLKNRSITPLFILVTQNFRKFVNWKLPPPIPRNLFAYYHGLFSPSRLL